MAYEFEQIATVHRGETFREYICKSGLRFFCTDNDEIMTDCGFTKLGRLTEGDKMIIDVGEEYRQK